MIRLSFRNCAWGRKSPGFTLIEAIIAAILMSVLMLFLYKVAGGAFKFLARNQARQQANMEARRCMETIERMLANGKANSVELSTPDTTPTVSNSQISFTGADGSAYSIAWSTNPFNSVHLFKTPSGSTVADDTLLAKNVNLLYFIPDTTDPSLINVRFRMTVTLDSSGSADSFYTIEPPLRAIRMATTQ